jgi:single-strand DNA-binding protein
MNVNLVCLGGRLTRDPALSWVRVNAEKRAIADFGMAVNEYVGKDKPDRVLFIDCTAWGRNAEIIGEKLHKGESLFVQGRLRLEQWMDKQTGKPRQKITLVLDAFQFVGQPAQKGPDDAKA